MKYRLKLFGWMCITVWLWAPFLIGALVALKDYELGTFAGRTIDIGLISAAMFTILNAIGSIFVAGTLNKKEQDRWPLFWRQDEDTEAALNANPPAKPPLPGKIP